MLTFVRKDKENKTLTLRKSLNNFCISAQLPKFVLDFKETRFRFAVEKH
jgi:hypothetical protein